MNQPLQIGFAAKTITPPPDCPLIGYTQRVDLHGDGNEGELDPLYVRVLLFDNGAEPPGALLSFDLCILEDPAADALRAQVAEQIGSARHRVTVAATHTHSGPYPWSANWPDGPREFTPDLLQGPASERYWEQLQKAVAVAVEEALENRSPAQLRVRTASLGFAYNRRMIRSEGIDMCWNPKEQPDSILQPAEDDSLVALEIIRESESLLIFNIGGHPVVLGKESNRISADWPGAACRQIELNTSGTRACFFHGAGADAHPWLATDNDPADLDTVAAPVAALVTLLHKSGGKNSDVVSFTIKESICTLHKRKLRLTAWRIGPLRVLAFPGELFGSSGKWLREKVPGPLLIATTANGWSGYWPPAEAFDQGGYEIDAVRSFGLERGDTERVLETAAQLLQQI